MILADEINRTPPKTQAALLEAMQEHHVTAGGQTYHLPEPFFVLATQNPIEQEGTYPLPEAQLDRFMFNIMVGYPSRGRGAGDHEADDQHAQAGAGSRCSTASRSCSCRKWCGRSSWPTTSSPTPPTWCGRRGRSEPGVPKFVPELVAWGAGPRASQYLILGGKARAILHGRLHVTTDDIRDVAYPVLRHRLVTTFNADAEGDHDGRDHRPAASRPCRCRRKKRPRARRDSEHRHGLCFAVPIMSHAIAAIPQKTPPIVRVGAVTLRYVTNETPGITRVNAGKQFRYLDAAGKVVRDRQTLARINGLVIPPAWTDVWICPRADGHIQAVGRDERGRKQYVYHADYRAARDEVKFERIVAFGKALPRIRKNGGPRPGEAGSVASQGARGGRQIARNQPHSRRQRRVCQGEWLVWIDDPPRSARRRGRQPDPVPFQGQERRRPRNRRERSPAGADRQGVPGPARPGVISVPRRRRQLCATWARPT